MPFRLPTGPKENMMNGAPPCPQTESDQRPVLLVLSHLRWDFVFQRPQQPRRLRRSCHQE
jgi:hypothetical protein